MAAKATESLSPEIDSVEVVDIGEVPAMLVRGEELLPADGWYTTAELVREWKRCRSRALEIIVAARAAGILDEATGCRLTAGGQPKPVPVYRFLKEPKI